MLSILPACTCSISSLLDTLTSLSESSWTQITSLGIYGEDLKGLNLFLLFAPEKLIFFSKSRKQLDYIMLILELIAIAESPEDFISRVFSRSVSHFIASKKTLLPFSQMHLRKARFSDPETLLKDKLTFFTQWAYLTRPYETPLLEDTLKKLSLKGKKFYERFLLPYASGDILLNERRCLRLLPCWPLTEKVPYEEKNNMGLAKNAFHELEPNTCTFFFGYGWLTQTATFKVVQQRLKKAQITFKKIKNKQEAFLEEEPWEVLFYDEQQIEKEWEVAFFTNKEQKERLLITHVTK